MDESTLRAGQHLPATLVQDSKDLGWQGVLCRTYREMPVTEAFESLATPDVGLIVVTSGTYLVETTRGHRWVSALFRPGSVALVLPHESGAVRWRSIGSEPMQSVHVHLADEVIEQALASARRPALVRPMSGVDQQSPYLFHAARALEAAASDRTSSLLAESLGHGIAAHLALTSRPYADLGASPGLGPRALADVVEHMHEHLADDISLDQLASVAFLTKWHFLRQFKRSTGQTPHAYLRDLRVEHAKRLLAQGATVAAAAHGAGLGSASQLARTFRRALGMTPGAYRDSLG